MIYIVRETDTYQRISAKVYGEWSIYMLIKERNDFSEIYLGKQLEIPIPRTESTTHICKEKENFSILSSTYYTVECFAELIKDKNENKTCSIGEEIKIPALVNIQTLRKAQKYCKEFGLL